MAIERITLAGLAHSIANARISGIRNPFLCGGDVGPESWKVIVSAIQYRGKPEIIPPVVFYGVEIHVRSGVPEGRVWPCECPNG